MSVESNQTTVASMNKQGIRQLSRVVDLKVPSAKSGCKQKQEQNFYFYFLFYPIFYIFELRMAY